MDCVVSVNLGVRSYPIRIGHGLLQRAGELLAGYVQDRRVVIVTDENVGPLYASSMSVSLERAGFRPHVLTVAAGEASKSLSVVSRLYDDLSELHFKRDETIVALGGGVVGDLAGFVAATWLRGVQFVQIPTTVLAQVDSSVGGKVGINHEAGKNLIGSFHHPLFVLIDPDTLETLPQRELRAGFAEVLKYGFIADRPFYERVCHDLESILCSSSVDWLYVLGRSCAIKARVVEQDERDLGQRHILNFGHTLGHALEAATGYDRLRHGEAVVRGMIAALWLSRWHRQLPEDDLTLGIETLKRIPTPKVDDVRSEMLMPHLSHDKKSTSSGQKWVLLDRIGKAVIEENLPEGLALRGARKMLEG